MYANSTAACVTNVKFASATVIAWLVVLFINIPLISRITFGSKSGRRGGRLMTGSYTVGRTDAM
jgi:hypothetical protein